MNQTGKKWQIDPKGLTYAYPGKLPKLSEYCMENFPTKIVESPKGNYALLLYGTHDMLKEMPMQNYILVENAEQPRIILKSDKTYIYLHGQIYQADTIVWSKDEEYVSLSISVCIVSCYDAKLIINIKKRELTFVPLAGSQYYRAEFLSRRKYKISYVEEGVDYISKLPPRWTYLSSFRWLPLSEFAEAGKLLRAGYFGNLLGYKWHGFNKRFKNSRNEWPYGS